jgi:hypothetical protein
VVVGERPVRRRLHLGGDCGLVWARNGRGGRKVAVRTRRRRRRTVVAVLVSFFSRDFGWIGLSGRFLWSSCGLSGKGSPGLLHKRVMGY